MGSRTVFNAWTYHTGDGHIAIYLAASPAQRGSGLWTQAWGCWVRTYGVRNGPWYVWVCVWLKRGNDGAGQDLVRCGVDEMKR